MSYGATSSTRETTRLLAENVASIHQSEEIGRGIGSKMRNQRETLESTNRTLSDMKTISASAAQRIQAIENKTLRKKLWLWAVVLFLFIANIVVAYRMYENGGRIFSMGIPAPPKESTTTERGEQKHYLPLKITGKDYR